jgi:hypothetical protein
MIGGITRQQAQIFFGGLITGAVIAGVIAGLIASGSFSSETEPVISLEQMVVDIRGNQVAEVNITQRDARLIYWTGKTARVEISTSASVDLIANAARETNTRISSEPDAGFGLVLLVYVLPAFIAAVIIAAAAGIGGYAYGRASKRVEK